MGREWCVQIMDCDLVWLIMQVTKRLDFQKLELYILNKCIPWKERVCVRLREYMYSYL